ncbi:MAG: hypothetical protein OEP45_16785, partial [Acidobacteriota bacterium]|nr:hypothetical protein [Acidobacteriota bacterium]
MMGGEASRTGAWLLAAALLASPAASAAEDTAGESEAAATIEARLEVEDSAPYVPASNTIAAKLPIEQVWTPA